MSQADLEISLFHRSANDYGVTLRFRHPAAGQDKSTSGLLALDEAALLQHQHDPTAYGELLAAQLFAGEGVRGFLDQALTVAASQQTPLHLRLFIHPDAEALHSLRWETLRLPGRAAPLAVGDRVRFSRYLDSTDWRPAHTVERDALRALVAVASPDVRGTTLAEVRTEDELAAARAGLGDIPSIELAGRGQVTSNNLLARLRDGCDILYLVAHGALVEGEPQILLEAADGGRAWTSGRELAARLGELAQPPSLVVLVSCQSAGTGGEGQDGGALAGLGPRLAAAGVPAVVAMQGNVSMATTAAFMPVFLRELRRDGQVDRAMAVARGAVHERPDWWMPVLYSRLEDGRVFELPNAADDPLFDLPPLPQLDLPDKPFHYLDWYRREDAELFFGRGREIRTLYDRVTAPDGDPIVLLYGQSGVGKSSVLAAGLRPRLEASHEVRYMRRDQEKGLLGTLAAGLPMAPDDDLASAWRRLEAQYGKPLLVVLDQVEEYFTRPNPEQPGELAEFLDALQELFGDAGARPRGRLILAFRKEWLAEIEKRLAERALPRVGVFLERLGRAGIAEVVAGPTSKPRLRSRYSLSVADALPGMIADDLLADRESPVAPMLAILLADMWDAAKARSYDRPVFDEDLYHEFRTRGLSLNDFLGRQLGALRNEMLEVVDSGLALDVLAFHTTPLGTAEQRALADLEQTYSHRLDVLPGLVQQCQDLYLLVDPAKNQPGQPPASRLTHDTLAPHVRKRFDELDAPGQRARRILESRAVGWEEGKEGPTLDDSDLEVVHRGMTGMRMWRSNETGLVAASRQQQDKRKRARRTWRMAGLLALALLLVAGAIVVFFEQARQSAAEAERISRAAYLATTGLLQYDQDATRGLLLATEATKIGTDSKGIPAPAAEQSLRSLIGRMGGHVISGRDAPQVTTMASSPTLARWVVLGNEAGVLMLWDLTSGSLLDEPLKLPGHSARITTSAISSDNTHMVTGDVNGSILVWDLAHLDIEPRTLATFDGMVDELAISPESDWVAASIYRNGQKDDVYLWRTDPANAAFGQGMELKEASGHFVRDLLFSPDDRWLFVGGQNGLALLWPLGKDGEFGAPTSLLQAASGEGGPPDVAAAIFDPFSPELAVGRSDGVIDMWNTSQPTPILAHSLNAGAAVSALGFGGNPVSLIGLGGDGRIRSWPPAVDSPADPMAHGPALAEGFAAITLSKEFPYMATQDGDGQVRLWHLGVTMNGNFDSREISSHRSGLSEERDIGMVLLTPDGRHLVTTGSDHITRAWSPLPQDFASVDFSSDPVDMGVPGGDMGVPGGYWAIALGNNGSWLAASDLDSGLRIWDIDGVEPTTVFTTFLDPAFITGLAFSSDDQHLLAVNDDRLIIYSRKGDAFAPVPSASITVSNTLATGAISGDGAWAVGGSWGGSLYRWRVGAESPAKIGQIEGSIQKISINADQRWITAQSDAGKLGIWQVDDTRAETLAWACPELDPSDFVTSAQFDSRGSHLILGGWRGEDGFIVLCDLTQAQKGTRIDIPQDPVRAIAIDDREMALLSGHTSGLIRRWKLGSSGASISLARQPQKMTQAGSAIVSLVMASDDEVIIVKAPGITSPQNYEIEVWNSRSLRKLRNLGGIPASPSEIPPFTAISKGARWLVISDVTLPGYSGTVQLTRLQVADLIDFACRQAGRELTPDEWAAFFPDESYHNICSQ